MILRNIKRIAADSNVILSAVIGKAALKIFSFDQIEILTTEFNLQEVKKYLPRLSSKYQIELPLLWLQLRMLPMIVFDYNHYESKVSDAKVFLERRDVDDVHLAALALKEKVPIWTNDKDFNVLPIQIYPTKDLLRVFDL